MLALGVGKGLFASPSRALLADLFSGSRGHALGIYAAGTDLGGLLAAELAAVVLATTVWRVAFVSVLVVLALVTTLFVVWNREPYTVSRVPLTPRETFGRIVATRARRERLLAYALFYFAVGGLTNFYPRSWSLLPSSPPSTVGDSRHNAYRNPDRRHAKMTAAKFIDHVSDPMLALEAGVVREANAPAQRLFGADEETIEGSPLADLFPRRGGLADRYERVLTHYQDIGGVIEDSCTDALENTPEATDDDGTTVRMRLPTADGV